MIEIAKEIFLDWPNHGMSSFRLYIETNLVLKMIKNNAVGTPNFLKIWYIPPPYAIFESIFESMNESYPFFTPFLSELPVK